MNIKTAIIIILITNSLFLVASSGLVFNLAEKRAEISKKLDRTHQIDQLIAEK